MFSGRSNEIQPVTRTHIPSLCTKVCPSSELQGLIYSNWNFFSQFCNSFSSKYRSRTKTGIDLEVVWRKGEFYQDYHGIVSFCNSRDDKMIRKTYTKTINFHDFCRIIQKFVFITQQSNWCLIFEYSNAHNFSSEWDRNMGFAALKRTNFLLPKIVICTIDVS